MEKLIVFTRYPEPGKAKTRLIPVLGEEGAANLQRKMTEHALLQVKKLIRSRNILIEVRFEGGDDAMMRNWLGSGITYLPQGSGDLGIRMRRAFEESIQTGVDAVVIIGTDIPDINECIVQQAFDALKQQHMVVGPAKDGGYYLIGLKREIIPKAVSDLFSKIQWGSDRVLENTLTAGTHLRLKFSLLSILEDIDRPEDLPIWERSQQTRKQNIARGSISIIIPVLNEAENIERNLKSVSRGTYKEIIVVDGGSYDSTVAVAKSMNAKVITTFPHRAHQLNKGADAATGDVLLFLHADTQLPETYDAYILSCLEQSGVVCGAFELRIDSSKKTLRLIEWLANFRSRYLKMPYGDQAIFIRSDLFHQMGKFPNQPIMEDFEFMRRLKKKGKIVTLSLPVFTSPRRWKNFGVFKTTIINQLAIIAYLLGVSPARISRWYRRSKGLGDTPQSK